MYKINADYYVTARDWRYFCDKYNLSLRGNKHVKDFAETYGDVMCGLLPVYQIEHTENRSQNYKGLLDSFEKLRDLINCNIDDINNVRWVTLTYGDNVTDTNKVYVDFKNFWRRLRQYTVNKYGIEPKYISAIEPQERGAWHIHLLMIFPFTAPYIPNDDLWKMWSPKGFKEKRDFVKIKSLYKNGQPIDNIGAYLSAYLTDTYSEDDKKTKKYDRLRLYPSGTNFYRCSKGLKRPEIEYTSKYKAEKKISFAEPTFSKLVNIDTDEFQNQYLYNYYNLKR